MNVSVWSINVCYARFTCFASLSTISINIIAGVQYYQWQPYNRIENKCVDPAIANRNNK